MDKKDIEKINGFLKEEMTPALGVTEPAAIAFATAKAYETIGGELKKIKLIIDSGVYKNGFSCAIPKTKERGNELAAILGVLAGEPSLELKVLNNITKNDIEKAKNLRDKNIAIIDIKKGVLDIFIDANVETDKGIARVVIEKKHTNIVLIEVNGKWLYKANSNKKEITEKEFNLNELNLDYFMDYIDSSSFEDVQFTLKAVKMNQDLTKAGINGAGMGLGKALNELVLEKKLSDDIVNYVQILTAYAVDARMGGMAKPAMTISGSGDHGLIATMPLVAIAERENIGKEKLAKAIALSYLITIYIKEYSGRLSAFCGCAVAAGTGVSAAIVYLLGGTKKQIGYTINNMASNITGIICDGGNFGCSLKAMTAASSATQSALFALKDIHIPNNSGIVGNSPEETMQNMGKIASPGMLETNKVILDIMINRHNN